MRDRLLRPIKHLSPEAAIRVMKC